MLEREANGAGGVASERADAWLGPCDEPVDVSVVDAVLWACEQSEDETEVSDLVDAALRHPQARARGAADAGASGPGPLPL